MNAPMALGDGLVLRWATAADMEALAEFHFQVHNENPGGESGVWSKAWTCDLMSGRHPTTKAGDVTVVIDEYEGKGIVSTAVLISQTWRYGRQTFGCDRTELVVTDPGYRQRGLVRAQFYRSQLTLTFDAGRLVKIGDYRPAHYFCSDAFSPALSFLQLLFGYRSLHEIGHVRPDCVAEQDEAAVLLKTLFPKRPSFIVPVA